MIRYLLLVLGLSLWNCSKNESNPIVPSSTDVDLFDKTPDNTIKWYIDSSYIIGAYAPFPEIDSVVFHHTVDKQISQDHRVALINIEGQDLVFLSGDLFYFETINFEYKNWQIAVTHCPITNTTVAFELDKGDKLKASGYRYHDNLVLYNPYSDSYYSQMLLEQIGGSENKLGKTIPILDTKWGTARLISQDLLVAQINDLHLGDFNQERLYESNLSNWDFMSISMDIDPIKNNIDLLHLKFDSEQFSCSSNGRTILGDTNLKLVRSFISPDEQTLTFNSETLTLEDKIGNKYNWNGNCLNCNEINKGLTVVESYIGSTASFNPLFDNIQSIK